MGPFGSEVLRIARSGASAAPRRKARCPVSS